MTHTDVINGKNTRICENCGTEYVPSKWNQKYCAKSCKSKKWNKDHVIKLESPDGKYKAVLILKNFSQNQTIKKP